MSEFLDSLSEYIEGSKKIVSGWPGDNPDHKTIALCQKELAEAERRLTAYEEAVKEFHSYADQTGNVTLPQGEEWSDGYRQAWATAREVLAGKIAGWLAAQGPAGEKERDTIHRRPGYATIDLIDLCATDVEVSSWPHSGPVNLTARGIVLEWLIDKLREAGLDVADPEEESETK